MKKTIKLELEMLYTQLKIYSGVIDILVSSLHLDFLAQRVLEKILEILPFNAGALHLYNPEENLLELKTHIGVSEEFIKKAERIIVGEGITGRTALYRRSIMLSGQEIDPRAQPDNTFPPPSNMRPIISLPIVPKIDTIQLPIRIKDELIGVLTFFPNPDQDIKEMVFKTLDSLCNPLALGFKNAMLYEEAEQMATKDGLTRLYNHSYLQGFLEMELVRGKRYHRPLTFAMLDIDNFKQINDTYGHQEGDLILKELADILRNFTRASDLVARYGGEEFAVVLPETLAPQAYILTERLRQQIAGYSFSGADHPLKITASCGIADWEPHYPLDQQGLIARADQALYQAKSQGRNKTCLWEKD